MFLSRTVTHSAVGALFAGIVLVSYMSRPVLPSPNAAIISP